MEEKEKKIMDLKEGENDVTVKVRVISTSEPKVIQTRKGPRTISEAIVGDETGRAKLTLWGKHAGTLQEGEAVEISGVWTTQYRGEVQLNVGYRGEIKKIEDEEVPGEQDIPEETPKPENPYTPRRRFQGGGFQRGRGYGYKKRF
ncbi:MAG: OB-fold nucleic acid binding domain-containing protein [Desulfurococcales archaeon]|nr:OB-fold nucleic acid binding domain-containing protein [Desulfurococcales archaeon]